VAQIDRSKFQDYVRKRRDAQNFGLGLLGGVLGAAIGAGIWGAITAATNFQIGWMAVGVGFLTGFGVRVLGNGIDKLFGYMGAALSFGGCLAGNLLSALIYVSAHEHIAFATVAGRMSVSIAWEILKATFSPIDVLFYALALYFGYRYSFRHITAAELEALRSDNPAT